MKKIILLIIIAVSFVLTGCVKNKIYEITTLTGKIVDKSNQVPVSGLYVFVGQLEVHFDDQGNVSYTVPYNQYKFCSTDSDGCFDMDVDYGSKDLSDDLLFILNEEGNKYWVQFLDGFGEQSYDYGTIQIDL